jgi:predicted Zn finger-like uncharacterized protein
MRIVCPSCSAAYEVADSLLTPGRIVQCARCGKAWVGLPLEAPLVDEPVPAEFAPDPMAERELDTETPRLTALDRLAQRAPPRSSRGAALRAAWAACIVVVLGLLWGAYVWRTDVMADWPSSVRLYSLLGLAAPQH